MAYLPLRNYKYDSGPHRIQSGPDHEGYIVVSSGVRSIGADNGIIVDGTPLSGVAGSSQRWGYDANWRYVPTSAPAASGLTLTLRQPSGTLGAYTYTRISTPSNIAGVKVVSSVESDIGFRNLNKRKSVYYGGACPDNQNYSPFNTPEGNTAAEGKTGGGVTHQLYESPLLTNVLGSQGTPDRSEWQYSSPVYCSVFTEAVRTEEPGLMSTIIRSTYRGGSLSYLANYGNVVLGAQQFSGGGEEVYEEEVPGGFDEWEEESFSEIFITLTVSPDSIVNCQESALIYIFTRDGSTDKPLTVYFDVGGTASFGTDYTQSGATSFSSLSGSVLIPAGQTTAQLTISSTCSAIVSDATVEITLLDDPEYTPETINQVVGHIYENIVPRAIQITVYIRSILEVISGNLLSGIVNTPGPNPTPPVISVLPIVGTGGPGNQIFELISASIGSYGTFSLSANGEFEYIVDLDNAIVRNLSPYTPPHYSQVTESFQFSVTDLAGNTSEGTVYVSVQASYTRIAAAFTFDPIPPVPPNQGRKQWFLNTPLISTLANPNDYSFGMNYPWTGPVASPAMYLTGYTDQLGNWLIGEPPPAGFFD